MLNHRSHVEKFCGASCSLKNATRRPIFFIRRLWLYRSQSTVCCQSHINSYSSLSNLRPFPFLVYSCMCPLPMLLFSLRLLIFFLTRPSPFQPILTSELKKTYYCLTFMVSSHISRIMSGKTQRHPNTERQYSCGSSKIGSVFLAGRGSEDT